ncbi:hypothetical protein KOR42_49210 [Thalassoglobus neptunius]|uniref:Uncharacterized protein n=1 Tax=Thalassoglobus neptunius TaxID=1938619 RepID=A0A5C5VPW0_9PLAN|nr:hypothetical protein [Thalassoglobus neptunius]TWT40614.1 hypothetical protein KOR42_49210 [Thalassoglobus neptunius]
MNLRRRVLPTNGATSVGTILLISFIACSTSSADDLTPINTQAAGEYPLPPEQAVKRLRGLQVGKSRRQRKTTAIWRR